jgi:hypothetical protein
MKATENHPDEELQELTHEPVPGYPVAFWIVLGVTTLVLIIAVLTGSDVSTHH